MATIAIPAAVQAYFPESINPSDLWVNYNVQADSLTIYFTGQPVRTIWSDIDDYAYVGFAPDDENTITGIMIEHFSRWLLTPIPPQQNLELV